MKTAFRTIGCVSLALAIGCSTSDEQATSDEVDINMLNLYKFSGDTVQYWEAWENGGVVTVHWGQLGERGTTGEVALKERQSTSQAITELSQQPRRDGFRELTDDEMVTFVIQYRLDNWGSTEDLQQRHAVENLMNETLGWTGNGHCDGGDIGSSSINIWCFVVAPNLAAQAAIADLRKNELLDGVIMAYRRGEDDFTVVYPADFTGQFSEG